MAKRIIYTDPSKGNVVIVTPSSRFTTDQLLSDPKLNPVPDGVSYKIVEHTACPSDRTFRDAWEIDGSLVKENISKSKTIAHEKRRINRKKEFKPYDDEVALNISDSKVAAAETERVKIRTKYATMQTNIDNATNIAGIKSALGGA